MKKILLIVSVFLFLVPFLTFADWCTDLGGHKVMSLCYCPDGSITIKDKCGGDNPDLPTCNFNYTGWSTCSASGTQTRTVTSSYPPGCTGGSPVLSQSCTPDSPTTCTSFNYSAWSTCSASGTQTRTVTSSSPSGCTGGSPVLSQLCTPNSDPGPPNSSSATIGNPIEATTFSELIDMILDWILRMALVLAPLVIVYGGLTYMTAAGDTSKVSQAKKIILYAVLGFILALLASSLIDIFKTLVTP